MFRKCRCYGGILRLTSSLFLFREERIQPRNLRFIGFKITMPARALLFFPSFPSVRLQLLFQRFFLPSLPCQRRVSLFSFSIIMRLSLLPFPLINQSTRCSKEFKERFSNSRETPLVFYLSFYRIDRTYRKPIVSHPRHVESVTF